MGRGGVDLHTAQRSTRTIDDILSQPTTVIFAVNYKRMVVVEKVDPLPSPNDRDTCHLFAMNGHVNMTDMYEDGRLWYIGSIDGVDYVGVVCEDVDIPATAMWMRIRQAGAQLPAGQSTACSHALALAVWHRSARYCNRCGNAYKVAALGWERHCPTCQVIEYPRQDPAIIVGVVDADDRLFLAHNVLWDNPKSFSVLAGYVEAGESPENAVAREVKEETNLDLHDITYVGSQAWPFPRSLMMGYMARCDSSQVSLQRDELDKGKFYTRQEFIDAVTAGDIHPAGPATIASALIIQWLGQPIPYPDKLPRW